MTVDYTPASDITKAASYAATIAEDIREQDPYSLYGRLVDLCALRPAFAAQVVMTFAVMFDPDTITTKELDRRADAIARSKAPKAS